MKPSEKFNQLVSKGVAPLLKEHGFVRSGLNFRREGDDTIALITIQKSRKSSKDHILFTINLGIASRLLLRFYLVKYGVTKLSLEDCHWRRRLGLLTAAEEDVWWSIVEETSIDDLGKLLCGYIEKFAIPEIDRYRSDRSLCDLWLTGRSPGLTNYQRLMNLTVLIKVLGPESKKAMVLEELRRESEGLPSASVGENHIRRLETESIA